MVSPNIPRGVVHRATTSALRSKEQTDTDRRHHPLRMTAMIQLSARFVATIGCTFAFASVAAAQSASLTAGGYTAPFNSMGTAGTAPPLGWTHLTLTGGSGTVAGPGQIPAGMVGSSLGETLSSGLTPAVDPTGTNNNGFNAAITGAEATRSLATSPTSVAAGVLQLRITNNTGGPLTQLLLSYDTRRFTTATNTEDLPGYQLFLSLNGGVDYQPVAALNPGNTGSGALVIIDNTPGLTTLSNFQLTLPSSLANGNELFLRYVDDNSAVNSPDQIVGLERFALVPVPEPGAVLAGS